MNKDGNGYTGFSVYTVAIYEFRGKRELMEVGGGGGEGRVVGRARESCAHLNSDWLIVFGEAWK